MGRMHLASVASALAGFSFVQPAIAHADTAARPCPASEVRFKLALPGFDSQAELLLPARKPVGVAVLLHGSDVEDRDGAVVFRDRIVSRPLKRIAEVLACRGLASLRYDKRYVTGPTQVDRPAFAKLTLQDFAVDAGLALDAAKARAELEGLPLFLIGWSEGTTVAADVAARRHDLAGVVLISPVATGFATSLQRQWPSTARPYVERYAKNGAIDAQGVAAAAAGPGGVLAQMYVGFLKGFAPESRLNAAIDANHDGRIDLASEADPTFKGWFADGADGGLGIYATSLALPGVAARIDEIAAPVLVLQGGRDGNVDPAAARRLALGRGPRVSVRLYPSLGHSLGSTPSPQEDGFGDPQAAPLRDIATWMGRHAQVSARP